MMKIKKIAILGDGAWGTTLAIHLAKKGYGVSLWGAFKENIELAQKARENKRFLPGYPLQRNIALFHDMQVAVAGADLIVLATPSEFLENTLIQLKKTSPKTNLYLSIVKGINPKTFERMSEMILRYMGSVSLAVLSGPTIASEVAAGIATTAVVACRNPKVALEMQRLINSDTFRIYTNHDMIGVEVGGSVKNVIALACGMCDGLGLGTNAKAAIVTRGLAEMVRLGQSLGAKTETFYGLTGLGDLTTTCFSPQSRNRTVGQQLGQGQSLKKIMGSMNQVAEGVITAKAVYLLSKKTKVSMPIVEQVYHIIYKGKNPRKAMNDLMTRSIKPEYKHKA